MAFIISFQIASSMPSLRGLGSHVLLSEDRVSYLQIRRKNRVFAVCSAKSTPLIPNFILSYLLCRVIFLNPRAVCFCDSFETLLCGSSFVDRQQWTSQASFSLSLVCGRAVHSPPSCRPLSLCAQGSATSRGAVVAVTDYFNVTVTDYL